MTNANEAKPAANPKVDAHEASMLAAFNAFMEELKKESDRAAVIIAGAQMDLLLSQVLAARLLPESGRDDALLRSDGPIGTFSARIDLCYRLGLITREFARALHLVRRIRNEFAHEAGAKLDVGGSHSQRIKELALPYRGFPGWNDAIAKYFNGHKGAAADFRMAASALVASLEDLLASIQPLSDSSAQALFRKSESGSAKKEK